MSSSLISIIITLQRVWQQHLMLHDLDREYFMQALTCVPLVLQVWHYQSELQHMDAHYRRQLNFLEAAKEASDAEVQRLREEAAAVAQLRRLTLPLSLQPGLSWCPPAAAGRPSTVFVTPGATFHSNTSWFA